MLEIKSPSLSKQGTSVKGKQINKSIFSLNKRKKMQINTNIFYIQGMPIDNSQFQTLDYDKEMSADTKWERDNPQTKLTRYLVSKNKQMSMRNTNMNDIDVNKKRVSSSSCQNNVYNIQFPSPNAKTRHKSTHIDKMPKTSNIDNNSTARNNMTLINHKLRLKTLENRITNKYYTIQLSTKNDNTKRDITNRHLNITNYNTINFQHPNNLQNLWF